MVAGTEPNAENKLFVGGCPPGSSEEDLRQIFEKYGTVEEVFIMRGGSRSGMACAFVRFQTQEMAQQAIDNMRSNVTLANAPEPLVVRWADAPGSRKRDGRDRGSRRGGGSGSSRDHGSGRQSGQPVYMQQIGYPQMQMPFQMQMPLQAVAGGMMPPFYPQPGGMMGGGFGYPPHHQQLQMMALQGQLQQPQAVGGFASQTAMLPAQTPLMMQPQGAGLGPLMAMQSLSLNEQAAGVYQPHTQGVQGQQQMMAQPPQYREREPRPPPSESGGSYGGRSHPS